MLSLFKAWRAFNNLSINLSKLYLESKYIKYICPTLFPTIYDKKYNIKIKNIYKISFINIYFKYDKFDKYTLSNINFTINTSECISINGKSGSDKSTIINLIFLLKFYIILIIILFKTVVSNIK